MARYQNFTEYLLAKAPPRWKGPWGERFIGVLGLTADIIAEHGALCFKMGLLAEPTSPDDVLAPAGEERRLFRYPGETADAYRARLLDAWAIWGAAGDESGIDGQLAAAGLDATVYVQPAGTGPWTPAYFFEFFVLTTEIGDAERALIVLIVNKFKPVDWVLRGLLFTGFTTYANAIAELAIGEDSIAA